MEHWGDLGGIFYKGVQVGKIKNWKLVEETAEAVPDERFRIPGVRAVRVKGWTALARRYSLDGARLAEMGVPDPRGEELEFRFLHSFGRCVRAAMGNITSGEIDVSGRAVDRPLEMQGHGSPAARFL